ncbi:MAG: histidine phosphatase family protein [Clostridia bacterium]|nr:histidine phosphatase family protein [Clostridia bacterium]
MPESRKARTLYFVRHAEPLFPDGERVYLGRRLDYPLCAEGKRQAEAVAETLAAAGVTAVFTSPLTRCRETADAIARRVGCTPAVLEDLTELDPGLWEGRTVRSVREEYGEAFEKGLCFPPPGGETDAAGMLRAQAALSVIRKSSGNIAVVSHGGLIRILLDCLRKPAPGTRSLYDIRCAVPIPVTETEDGRCTLDPRFLRA